MSKKKGRAVRKPKKQDQPKAKEKPDATVADKPEAKPKDEKYM